MDRWTHHLSTPAGTTFFFTRANALLLLLFGIGLLAIAIRRRRGELPARMAAWAFVGALGTAAASLAAHAMAGGSRGTAGDLGVLAWEIALFLVAVAWMSAARPPRAGGHPHDLGGLLVLSLLARLAWLTSPAQRIHFEEMVIGLWADRARRGQVADPFTIGYSDIPMLNFAVKALLMGPFSDRLLGLRLSSVLCGLGVVFFVYLVVAEVVPGRSAPALAGIFAAFHHVLLHYSRDGIHIVDPALALSGTMFFLIRYARSGPAGWPAASMAGAWSGLLVQDYAPSRAAPVIALLFFGLRGGARGGRRQALRGAAAFAAGFVIALGPLVTFFARNHSAIWTRESEVVGIGRVHAGILERAAAIPRQAISVLWIHSLGMDRDPRYQPDASFLHPLSIPFVLLGLACCARRRREPISQLVLLSAIVVLGLGAVPMKEIAVRRTVAILPVAAILYAMGAEAGRARRRRSALVLAFGCLSIASMAHVDLVLRRYPRSHATDLATAAATYLVDHPGEHVTLLTTPELAPGSWHIQFLAPGADVRAASSAGDVAEGTVLVSARHASALAALAARPRAMVETPWPLPGSFLGWAVGARVPTSREASDSPPVLVHLPAAAAELRSGPGMAGTVRTR